MGTLPPPLWSGLGRQPERGTGLPGSGLLLVCVFPVWGVELTRGWCHLLMFGFSFLGDLGGGTHWGARPVFAH